MKTSDAPHEELRNASTVFCRSINAQAEFWMKIGRLAEANPTSSFTKILAKQLRDTDVHLPVMMPPEAIPSHGMNMRQRQRGHPKAIAKAAPRGPAFARSGRAAIRACWIWSIPRAAPFRWIEGPFPERHTVDKDCSLEHRQSSLHRPKVASVPSYRRSIPP